MAESSPQDIENTVGEGEIACYKQFLLFPTEFSKDLYCRHVKIQSLFGKELISVQKISTHVSLRSQAGQTWAKTLCCWSLVCIPIDQLTLSQTANLDSSKMKVFADDNSEFDKNGRRFSKQLENTVGKGEVAHYEQFLLFPRCFPKACSAY